MKKFSLMLAMLGLVGLALAGCSKDEQGGEPETTAAEEPETTAAEEPETTAAEEPETTAAGEPETAAEDPHEAFEVVTVEQLAGLLSDGAAEVSVVDANGESARKKHGVIPGAKLLSNSSRYEPEEELPETKDETLVFYCYNESCGAAPEAAEKAVIAGYSDVKVLPAGIVGWKGAGHETQAIN